MSNTIEKGGILLYGPSVLAGGICGVIVNIDKALMIEAFFIAIVAATIITNFSVSLRGRESIASAFCATGVLCIWVVAFSMIVSGLTLWVGLKLFEG
jgi:hypothetical protein